MICNDIAPSGSGISFTLKEATNLINQHVVKNANLEKDINIEHIGFVAGVIHLNDEVEVIVKFMDELRQLTREQFSLELTVIDDD